MRFVGILILASLGLLAQDITREGSDWVRRTTGTELVTPRMTRIEVHVPGSIVVRESPDNRLLYTFTQRTGGSRPEAQARQLLGGVLTPGPMPNGAMVFAAIGTSGNATTTLELGVPRQFSFASLDVTFGGDISVYDFKGNVYARTGSGAIRGDRIHGSVVQAITGNGEIHFGTVDGSIDCSTGAGSITIDNAGGRVNCTTGGGETVVKQAGGPVVLNAEGGDISVQRADASVDARSASGLISVGRAGGNVVAITRGGSIIIGPARGVHAESGQGRIHVYGVSGPLSLQTAIGSILAELVGGAQLQDSSVLSHAGDITVFIPSNLAVSVMATEDSGGSPRIQSEFPEMPPRGVGWQRPPVVVRATINGGGPVLNLSAHDIYLRKATK
jgi:DUF4097 and DUF4098 domain-containing protein YvlB